MMPSAWPRLAALACAAPLACRRLQPSRTEDSGDDQKGAFWERRRTLAAGITSRVHGARPLSAAETNFEREILRPAIQTSAIRPHKSFLEHRGDYDASELLAILQRMPKGAILHTHSIATSDLHTVVDKVQADGGFFVWQGDPKADGMLGHLGLRRLPSNVMNPDIRGWTPAAEFPREKLYAYLTLAPGLKSVEECWDEFGKLWMRIRAPVCAAELYLGRDGILWETLLLLRKQGVMYLEIKENIHSLYQYVDHNGVPISLQEWARWYQDTVELFCAEHPDFVGCRLVLTTIKNRSHDQLRKEFREALALKETFPDLIAAFDMAGPEDLWNSIASYANILEEEQRRAKGRNLDLPLVLHAGETNVPTSQSVLDAVAIGCKRIGHGFALARFPTMIDSVIESGISLECCPISNQVLGYTPDLAAHPALGLFRAGVTITISSDDPGMWHYTDVAYDFTAVAKAWNLSLVELKCLCRNSLECSCLEDGKREEALKVWEREWDLWIANELRRHDASRR